MKNVKKCEIYKLGQFIGDFFWNQKNKDRLGSPRFRNKQNKQLRAPQARKLGKQSAPTILIMWYNEPTKTYRLGMV